MTTLMIFYIEALELRCYPRNDSQKNMLNPLLSINNASLLYPFYSKANRAEQFSKTEESVIGTLAEFYANSSFYRDTEARLQELSDGQKRSSAFEEVTNVTSFCHQFRWNLWRAFKNSLGFPFITLLQVT